jgi:hypothetical protein
MNFTNGRFYIVDAESGENRGSVVQDDYDPYTGKYAFVSPEDDVSDEEYEAAAQEAYDNLVRSCIEAGGEIRELKEMLREAKDALLYMLILHKAQDPRCNQEKVVPALYMLQSGPDRWTPERADEVFKKIFDYIEKE